MRVSHIYNLNSMKSDNYDNGYAAIFFSAVIFFSTLFVNISTTAAQQSLIPMPTEASWTSDVLDVKHGITVETDNPSLENEYQLATTVIAGLNITATKSDKKGSTPTLLLSLSEKGDKNIQPESYQLSVNKDGITIKASDKSGLFYGLQTLKQFEINNHKIPFCDINDKPAFAWRAYLVDVGRNYQPLDMLKKQIDVMAAYKLNVLHFHFTEDIAWRLVSEKYPGLTDAKYMTRGKGLHYTQKEFESLIDYCEERHITFLPEIDMPGHSKAFSRFFGVDMQSDSGMIYIKELLKEFSETYPELPYMHIGGDEVKITNKNFMPEITRYVESLGYKTIGWDPGSNLSRQTIRQLWMGGPKVILEEGAVQHIDSKHLYINHMDPLETVTTLFHRKIGLQDYGHANLLGGTLCVWPDRAVLKPEDILYQNAVYPSILTYAERIWRGGGETDWICNVMPSGSQGYQEFEEFETRLLFHKKKYFHDEPFPYTKQTDITWNLVGPFENGGDLTKGFAVEQATDLSEYPIFKKIKGGTIILRHWWNDVIKGAIDNPQENTTWYAYTQIWSDSDQVKQFWIGFNDLSRSYASDSPSLGTWDTRKSAIWVNNKYIAPPTWKQAGIKGDIETPLIDEGYSFRKPKKIKLKKGWNNVLVKLPVGSFQGRTWDNPIKWMFTFVPYNI